MPLDTVSVAKLSKKRADHSFKRLFVAVTKVEVEIEQSSRIDFTLAKVFNYG